MADPREPAPQQDSGGPDAPPRRVLVTDADGPVGVALVERLWVGGTPVRALLAGGEAPADAPPAEGVERIAWPADPERLHDLLAGVDLLLLPDLAAVDWRDTAAAAVCIARLEAVLAASRAAGVARVVLLSSAEAYGPGALRIGALGETAAVPGPELQGPELQGPELQGPELQGPEAAHRPLARIAALEALARESAGASAAVLRTLEVMAAAAPGPLARVRAILDGQAAEWPEERLHGIAATDVAEAMILAGTSPAAVAASRDGATFNLAAPEAISGAAATAEIHRMAEALSDPARTEVWVRPSHPPVAPLLDTARAARVLHFRPRTTLWTCLAQLVQAVVQERRRAGKVPPAGPRMPAAAIAVETGARPLAGRVAVLTGATAGIGRATALLLARLGAEVVGVGRNADAGAALVTEIDRIAGAAPARFLVADLSDMASVRSLAGTLCARCPRIDLLINNAGAVLPERSETAEGHERTLALNLLAPLLLTRLLAAPLTAAGGQVINLSSESHRNWPVDLGDPQSAFDYRPLAAYGRAKSGLIMLTYVLAELARDSGVRFNAINPGAVRTEILTPLGDDFDTAGLGPQAVQRVEAMRERLRQQLISPRTAALHVVNLAVDPELCQAQGLYLDKDAVVASAPHTCDRDTALRFWTLCCGLVGLEP